MSGDEPLTPSQQRALQFVDELARSAEGRSRGRLQRLFGLESDLLDWKKWSHRILDQASVTVQFHPGRILPGGLSVAESLRRSGAYRSQFETGISNGGLTAHAGGERFAWEERLFGGSYGLSAPAKERPKYAGLSLLGAINGACPRFGSCHFRLKKEILDRSTFCFGDSVTEPTDRGTRKHFESVTAAILEQIAATGEVFGKEGLTLHDLVGATSPQGASASRFFSRALNSYVETQVHGPIELGRDVEALVADECFEGTPVGSQLAALATEYRIDLQWVFGPVLDPSQIRLLDEFRGEGMASFAEDVAKEWGEGGKISAWTLCQVARDFPVSSGHRGATSDLENPLQRVKYLWHALVHYGEWSG